MPADEKEDKPGTEEEKLLIECREDFAYAKSYWHENYDEAEKDMDCVLCVPPKEFTDDRAGKPCIWPDEISQYVNQTTGNMRQSKRSIKISPRSEDAKDLDAEHRQAYIRGIEYASKAQSIYTNAFESSVECGFGFWRISLLVTGPRGEQEPRLRPIPNWATVYPDPDAKELDFADSDLYFVTDTMRTKVFARRYPNAKKKSFSGSDAERVPDWLFGDDLTVLEWWKRKEIEQSDGEKRYQVTQRITNGFEILETNKWIGSWIPIVGVFGPQKYKRTAGKTERVFLSLVRRARAPQQMLAYVASKEAEEFGMATASPYLVLKGTVDGEIWSTAHKTPRAYLEYMAPDGWDIARGAPPLPQRTPFEPNIQQYQLARESWRRSVQAGMGMMPLPTAAQRQNEKSGVALERIQTAEAIGSIHFTDSFVGSFGNTGRQLNELITKLAELDSLPKQLLGKDQKNEDRRLYVVPRTQDAASEHLPEADQFFAHRGQFEVTVSDGPNYLSEREEASAFADHLIEMLPSLGLPPALTQQLLSIAVKLKNIGTYGDEIADLLAPPDPNNIPPQAKAILAQAQGQIQQLTQELQKLQLEKLGKVTEMQGKMALAQQEGQTRMAEADKDRETRLAVAEITALKERVGAAEDMMKQLHAQAHELGLQVNQQQHEKDVAAQQAQSAQAQQATQIAADQQNQVSEGGGQ